MVNCGCPRYDPCFELLFIERISLSLAANSLLINTLSLYSYLTFSCNAAISLYAAVSLSPAVSLSLSLLFYSFVRSPNKPIYALRREEDGLSVLLSFTLDYSWRVLIFC